MDSFNDYYHTSNFLFYSYIDFELLTMFLVLLPKGYYLNELISLE